MDFRSCNHHHPLDDEHEIVDFGDGTFVANKAAIPLLRALAEVGLRTRTHHVDDAGGFVGILLDNVEVRIRRVHERDADRTRYNGKTELLLQWTRGRGTDV